jgi:hypothetical protein
VRHDTNRGGNISASDHGETRDIAAAKAGLGSGKTLEAAQRAISKGHPALVFLLCRRHANSSTKLHTATIRQRKQEKRSNEKSLLAIK